MGGVRGEGDDDDNDDAARLSFLCFVSQSLPDGTPGQIGACFMPGGPHRESESEQKVRGKGASRGEVPLVLFHGWERTSRGTTTTVTILPSSVLLRVKLSLSLTSPSSMVQRSA